ncbi:hypothetical protein KPL70_012228 [Citrus sinensis]|nr:hypothetical protein KPL70_012228 [Citrus sinensis]
MAVSPLICRGHFALALIVARHHRLGDHQPLFFSFIIKIKDKKRGIDKERRRRHRSCSHSSDRLRNRPKSLSPSRALSKSKRSSGFDMAPLAAVILPNEEVECSYEEFYEDVHTEFLKFGEIVNFNVCRNGSSHLRGNVYVLYKSLESAVLAYHSVNGRYFAGKQTCSRGMACNFIHCFRNPGGDYEWADWDKPPPRYWVKKMAALFGYSNESGTWNQECSGQTRKKIDSTNADRYAFITSHRH